MTGSATAAAARSSGSRRSASGSATTSKEGFGLQASGPAGNRRPFSCTVLADGGSMKVEKVIPLLTCRDIEAEHDFLVRAFGFTSGGLHRTPEGEVVHGEVSAGTSNIWLHRVALEHHLDSPQGHVVTYSGL